MTDEEITCWECTTKIIQYYHAEYKGQRGMCPSCGVEFPLE